MPIGTGIIYNVGDLILSQVSGSGTAFLETKIAAATSSLIYFDSTAKINSASLNSITVGTASYVSGSRSIITNLTASNISASGTGSFGMVGIGTTSPAYKLDVNGTIALSGFPFADKSGNYNRIYEPAGNVAIYLGNASDQGNYYDNTTHYFRNRGGASNYVIINNSGNVGIGTSSPTAKLHIYNGSSHFEATSNGNAAIVAGLYALQIAPLSNRDSTAGSYYGGIAFNHLLNHNGVSTYNGAPQAWIGTRLQDTAGSERDYLVFATKPGTGTSGTGNDIPIERVCIDRDGNVGIGTTNPTINGGGLHVYGSGQKGIRISGNSSNSYSVEIGCDATKMSFIQTVGTADRGLQFYTGNASTVVMTLTGSNVGIGTTSPSSKFEVLTSAVALANQPNIIGNFRGDTDGRSLIRVDNTSTSAGAAALQSGISFVAYSNVSSQPSANKHEAQIILGSTGANSVTGGQTGTLQIVAPQDIAFNVSASNTIMTGSNYTAFGYNAMYIARSGNIGIGTTVPGALLEVSSSTAASLLNVKGAGGNGILFVSGSGLVGIGTSSPSAKLEIVGFSTGAGLKLNYGNSSGTIEAVNFIANGAANGVIGMQMVSAGVGDLWLGGSGGRILTLYRDGNVGIGTTSPGAKLDVVENTTAVATLRLKNISSTGYSGIEFLDPSNNVDLYIGLEANGGGSRYNSLEGGHRFYISSTEKVRINTDGNVGIGTTSPTGTYGKLSVAGGIRILDDNNAKLEIGRYSSGASNSYIKLGSNSNSLRITNNTDDADIFTIENGGNVGIGTTSPYARLHSAVTANGYNPSLTYNSVTSVILENWGVQLAMGVDTVNSQTFYLQARQSANVSWPMSLNPLGGNVGIGTTSPAAKLNISLAGVVANTVSLINVSSWGNNTVQLFNSNGGTTGNEVLLLGTQAGGNGQLASGFGFGRESSATWGTYISLKTHSPSTSVIDELYERMRIAADGNVGIGTTNPAATLQVAGNISGSSFTSSISNAVGFLGTSSWASNAVTSLVCTGNAATATTASYANALNAANSYTVVDVNTTGNIRLRNGDPTITLSDTNDSSSFIHVDGNYFSILCGPPNASFGEWVVPANGRWPMEISLTNNTSTFGGSLDAISFTGSGSGLFGTAAGLSIGGTAATASYANALNPANSYTITNLTASNISASGTNIFGNVGIGTTSPSYKLDVQRTSDGTIGYFRRIGATINPALGIYANESGNSVGLNTDYVGAVSPAIAFSIATSEKVRIANDGNVGIGTTNPTAKLTVNGNLGFSGDSYNYIYMPDTFQGTGSIHMQAGFGSALAGGAIKLHGHNATTYTGGDVEVGMSGKGNFLINDYIGGTRLLTVSASGNVGIGSTSPNVKLVVYDNKDTSTWNSSASGVISNIQIHNYASAINKPAVIELLQNDHSVVRLVGYKPDATTYWLSNFGISVRKADTNMHQVFTAQYDGNIGIGTTSPSTPLHVFNTAATLATFTRDLATDVGFSIGADSNGTVFSTAGAHAYQFYTNGTEKVRIISDGNVGIGTTSPNKKLQIIGSLGKGLNLYEIPIDNLGAVGTQAKRFEIARVFIDYNDWNNTGPIEIEVRESYYSDGRYKRYVVSYGYASINTGSLWLVEDTGRGSNDFKAEIGAAVQVTGDIYYVPIYIDVDYYLYVDVLVITNRPRTTNDSFTAGGVIYINESPTGSNISSFGPDEVTYISLASNKTYLGYGGNVGIGTSNPTNKLHIYTSDNEPVLIQGTTAGTWLNFQSSTSNLLSIGADGTRGIGFYNRTTNANLMTISNVGNVGIGTTSPASRLHVVGSEAYIRVTDSDDSGVFFIGNTSGFSYIRAFSRDFRFLNAAGTSLINIASGGNIGIGTTSPANKLEVVSDTANNGSPFAGCFFSGDDSSAMWRCAINLQHNANTTIAIGSSVGLSFAPLSSTNSNFYGSAAIKAVRPNTTANNQDTDLAFWTRTGASNNTVDTEKLRITGTGNVGIGTTSPTAPLHVVGVISGSSFTGAGTGLTGTAASLTAGAVTNGVYTTGAQSVGGVKSFTSTMNVTGVRETMTTVAAATNVAINLNLGTIFKLTFSSTVSTFTITNTDNTNVAAGNSFTLISAPDNSNAKTIAFSFITNGAAATAVKWATFAGGTTPTATITSGKFDVFSFVYDGVNWYGFTGGLTY